jgi:sialic acid synthase SpsE/mannose-6-phosphate isomerase-like protein (cupin superfamily)
MTGNIPSPLFVLEMANNHMGDIDHGLNVIRSFGEVCKEYPQFNFAFKLQYRDLDTFIHPAMQGREDIKYVKRFSETRLSREQFDRLIAEIRTQGFKPMSTPFDEKSVDLILEQDLDIIKIASCSFTDWPLLERVVMTNKPIIASTAGASLADIDHVVNFFRNRKKNFALMHCVGEYPTPDDHMNISQISFLKERYPGIRVGFSTHENPDNFDIVKLALAKGADIFEKHVGLPTEKYPLNNYSASPEQVAGWLDAAQKTLLLCGVPDRSHISNPSEKESLRSLRRGMFVKRPISAGQIIHQDDIYFAFPPSPYQFTANDWSKYVQCTAKADIQTDEAVSPLNAILLDQRETILKIAQNVRRLLSEGGIMFPGCTDLEISHHYGIENFWESGLTMLTVVNRAYCKKLLILFAGQRHPEQYHKVKEETFHVLYGTIKLELDGKPIICKPGDVVTVNPGVVHAFSTADGAVIEEISSTHNINDSYYLDPLIDANRSRKTLLSYWID